MKDLITEQHYDAATTYNIGDVVRYTLHQLMLLLKIETNVSPDSDATVGKLIAQGDTGAVLTTRGDIIKQDALNQQDYQLVFGSVLTTDGTDPIWSNAEGKKCLLCCKLWFRLKSRFTIFTF